MSPTEIPILKQRIQQVIQSDDLRAAAQAVESFANRLTHLSHRINELAYDERNAIKSVLYARLEMVLMRFEELEWLGPRSGPVSKSQEATEAMRAFGVRSDKIDNCLGRLPIVEKLATAAILHRELEEVVKLFEQHEWLQGQRSNHGFTPQSRMRWN